MADTPAQTPAPAPAAAPAAPAAPADPLVQVGDRKEPLSLVVKGFQALSATEKRAMESAKRAEELQAQVSGLAGDASRFRELQAMIAKDPVRVKEEIDRMISLATGVPISSQPNSGAADEMKLAARLQHVEAQLTEMRTVQATGEMSARIKEAMGAYPLYQNSEAARRVAEVAVSQSLRADPKTDISDLVSRIHTDMQSLVQGNVAQTVAQRQATAAATAAAPTAAGGTPGLTNPPPPLNRNSIKDGTLTARLMDRWNALRSGPNATTG